MKRAIFFFSIMQIFVMAGSAQDSTLAPHGGILSASHDFRMEVVPCYEYLEVYLYEASMCSVGNHGPDGVAEFYFPDGSRLSSSLHPYGVEAFTATVPQQCFAGCRIGIRGMGISVAFYFPDL